MEDFALIDRFISALEAGDEQAVRQCYADDAVIWHNFDDVEQSVDDNVASLHWLRSVLENIRYEGIRRQSLPDGVLQQHVLTGRAGTRSLALPACVVFRIADGRIARLEEYLDPAPLMRLLA